MEVFYFQHRRTPCHLQKACEDLNIIDGQPFVLDKSGVLLKERCAQLGIDCNSLAELIEEPHAPVDLSYPPEINEFLLFRTSTSKSPNTWKADAEQLTIFLRWIKAQSKGWEEVTIHDLRAFYRARRLQPSAHTKKPISPKTWNACVSTLSRFYEWALDEVLITKLPFTYRQVHFKRMGHIKKNTLMESAPSEPVRYVTFEEYKIFCEALKESRNGERDRTLADFLLATGLRVSEACSLEVTDLPDPDAPRYTGLKTIPFSIVGKGGKKRKIRIPKSILRGIERYKGEDRANAIARVKARMSSTAKRKFVAPNALWLTERATPLTPFRCEEIFKTGSDTSKIKCTPHMLRHTFAIYTLSALVKRIVGGINEFREGGQNKYEKVVHNPLRTVQMLLGHAHISTTFIYLDLIEQAEEIVDDAIDEWTGEILT
jgi:site-specific recombinase XerD